MSTIDEQIRAYQAQEYNVLLPSANIQRISEFHDTVLEVVPLSLTCGDAYPYDNRDIDKAQKFGIAKPGLLKLSHAAGIVWRWEATQRIDQLFTRDYVAYQAVGALRQADGTWIDLKGSYELDLEVVEQELRTLYTKIARSLRREQKLKTEDAVQAYIADNVRQEVLRKRKHKLRLAETGAMLAVIRSLLAMKSLYTRQELQRPFVVPRVVFSPNLTDPEIRRAMILSSVRAVQDLYGVPAPATARPAIDLPPGEPEGTEDRTPGAKESPARTPEVTTAPPAAPLPAAQSETSLAASGAQDTVATRSVTSHPDPVPHTAPPTAAATPERQPPDVPVASADSVPQIRSLEEFAQCPRELIPAALRVLMPRKGFKATLLTNPRIEDWTHEQHCGFVKMLLARPDVVLASDTSDSGGDSRTRPAT